jgi:hypothetical protein
MKAYVADAHAHVQRLVSVSKWRPCLRSVIPKSSVLLYVVSCGRRDSMKRISLEKLFMFTRKCLSRKAVHKWVQKFSRTFESRRWWNGGAELAETTVKKLLCCGFRRTGEEMGQVYQCCWRICREINVFSRFEYYKFYVLYPFVTCLLALHRNSRNIHASNNRGTVFSAGPCWAVVSETKFKA